MLATAFERRDGGRIVAAEDASNAVGQAHTIPNGVLLCARQHTQRLDRIAI
jgi:hypothetical protein